ncbi:cellulose synthase [Gordonibacter sp. 28C]|uniref:ABC transporter substrate-binding protein n=1 Tax=Gordonibacter sp. 28C TaxID=2078569 RepID=UPI000DF864FA|nr:extracellular solute-binding protein [Gordonibacter sp. 28C]RDB61946.1 cellulose synthase [Gordonibacter sp. 28C]
MPDTRRTEEGTFASSEVAFDVEAVPGAGRRAASLTRRRFLAVSAFGLAGVCASLALPGCSTSKNIVVEKGEETPVDTKLTFFGCKYESINVAAIEEILREYMDGHPNVYVSYEGIKSRPYYEALEKRLASGNGDDVFMVDHDTELLFEERGYLADLSDLRTVPTFSALALGQMRSESRILYVPTSISAFGLYCNTDLLAAHGVAAPRTIGEFESACETFLSAGIVPLVANNDISLKTLAIARGMAEVYAADDANKRIEALSDDPEALSAQLRPGLDLVERFVKKGYVDAALALETEKTANDLEQFATGQYPFMLTGAWASVRVRDMAPDLAYEVHPYPVLDGDPVLVVNVDTRVSVNANGAHVDAAKDFATFFTEPSAIARFANSQCSFSPLEGNAAPDDEALGPLAGAFASGVVIGSDDNIHLPVWGAARKSVVSLLEGASAADAQDLMRSLLAEEADGDR